MLLFFFILQKKFVIQLKMKAESVTQGMRVSATWTSFVLFRFSRVANSRTKYFIIIFYNFILFKLILRHDYNANNENTRKIIMKIIFVEGFFFVLSGKFIIAIVSFHIVFEFISKRRLLPQYEVNDPSPWLRDAQFSAKAIGHCHCTFCIQSYAALSEFRHVVLFRAFFRIDSRKNLNENK